jgi:hypothetical protein
MAEFLPCVVFLAIFAGVTFLALRSFFPRADVEQATAQQAGGPILSPRDFFDSLVLPVMVVALFVIMLHVKYDYVSVLWHRPMGIKMLIAAGTSFVLGHFITIVLYIVRNRTSPAQRGFRALIFVGLLLTFLLLMLPMVFVLLVGPAAIQIMEGFQ